MSWNFNLNEGEDKYIAYIVHNKLVPSQMRILLISSLPEMLVFRLSDDSLDHMQLILCPTWSFLTELLVSLLLTLTLYIFPNLHIFKEFMIIYLLDISSLKWRKYFSIEQSIYY